MHVLYFHQHFSTPDGSTGIRSYQMSRRLIEAGNEVTMVCGSFGSGETGLQMPFHRGRREGLVDGVRVIEFDLSYSNKDGFVRRSWLFLKFALRSVGVALGHRYDILFATTTPLTVGIAGIAARWLRGKPFIFEVRDLWPELPREMGVITNPVILGLMSALEWASYRSAHRCVALSPGIADGITRRGFPRERIAMIPNGSDLDIFAAAEPWAPEGITSDDFLVVFTGTHGVANGLDAVLDAAKTLMARGRSDIRIVLVGDGKTKPALAARVEREKITNVLLYPPIPKVTLARLMARADLGLQCLANVPAFYYGTSPNKFFDYIASGLPVLNNYPGWLADMIKENACGYVVPPNDPETFADALEQASEDRAGLRVMGDRALQLAQREFDRSVLADRWVAWVIRGERL